ncbi:MAG: hypothetical protein OQK46_03770, partial [Gammaproteobacteria bacterium]|nr:hypothetical protein [Gammaproteobacteria bacterium]
YVVLGTGMQGKVAWSNFKRALPGPKRRACVSNNDKIVTVFKVLHISLIFALNVCFFFLFFKHTLAIQKSLFIGQLFLVMLVC